MSCFLLKKHGNENTQGEKVPFQTLKISIKIQILYSIECSDVSHPCPPFLSFSSIFLNPDCTSKSLVGLWRKRKKSQCLGPNTGLQ